MIYFLFKYSLCANYKVRNITCPSLCVTLVTFPSDPADHSGHPEPVTLTDRKHSFQWQLLLLRGPHCWKYYLWLGVSVTADCYDCQASPYEEVMEGRSPYVQNTCVMCTLTLLHGVYRTTWASLQILTNEDNGEQTKDKQMYTHKQHKNKKMTEQMNNKGWHWLQIFHLAS